MSTLPELIILYTWKFEKEKKKADNLGQSSKNKGITYALMGGVVEKWIVAQPVAPLKILLKYIAAIIFSKGWWIFGERNPIKMLDIIWKEQF